MFIQGGKYLLKCLFRKKKRLIWNQGLKEDFEKKSDIKPEKAPRTCAYTSSS